MFDFVYDSRILLVYLAVKYEGDYQKIMTALHLNENVPYEEAMNVYNSLKCKVVTLLDYDYPHYYVGKKRIYYGDYDASLPYDFRAFNFVTRFSFEF